MKRHVSASLVGLFLLIFSCKPKFSLDSDEAPDQPPVEENLPVTDPDRLLPSALPTIGYPTFITGDTIYSSALNPQAWLAGVMDKVDLGSLTVKGKLPRMVAFGGGLTAGVSNGGLNREAQQFAYPNLVAHQMGIMDFKTPLLPEEEANGPGTFVYEHATALNPRWKEVVNNLAELEAGQPVKMTPYEGLIDNLAYPEFSGAGLSHYQCKSCLSAYASRFSTYKRTGDSTLLMTIRARQAYDLVIMESFYDAYVQWIVQSPEIAVHDWPDELFATQKIAMDDVLSGGKQGVVFTIPHFRYFGFSSWYDVEKLKKDGVTMQLTFWRNGMRHELTEKNHFYLKPTRNVDNIFVSALPGQLMNATINDPDVIDDNEAFIAHPERIINPLIRQFAKDRGLALVDLQWIYEQIHSGRYKTDDGMKIDGSRAGNFFSSDGIYPTPVGQAVIANEVIKAMNLKYGAHIPLINVTQFAQAIGVK